MTVNVSECIDGPGERMRLGYVRLWNGGRRVLAHVHEWEKVNGPVPDGLELDHLCRNRWCRNPAHLEAVTHAVNSRRSSACKLDEERAARIRSLYSTRRYTLADLGRRFGVTKQSIWLVVKGKQWAS